MRGATLPLLFAVLLQAGRQHGARGAIARGGVVGGVGGAQYVEPLREAEDLLPPRDCGRRGVVQSFPVRIENDRRNVKNHFVRCRGETDYGAAKMYCMGADGGAAACHGGALGSCGCPLSLSLSLTVVCWVTD